MSEANFTPGPWKIGQRKGRKMAIHAKDWGHLAEVYQTETSLEEGLANARLIACAPEMAEMLLLIFTHVSHGGPTREEAEALLRKAGVIE